MRIGASLYCSTALLTALALVPATAHAGGYELLPGGTQSVTRGGAVAARPQDAMLLEHNPAGLALLSGDQFLLNFDAPLQSMCVQPYGYYGWGVYQAGTSDFGNQLSKAYGESHLPEVCNSGQPIGIPQMAWAFKLTDDLALAAGFVAPTVVAAFQFGGADGTIDTPDGARPTPTRYQLIRQQVKFAAAPTVGIAYKIMQQLSVGLATQITMLRATSRAVQNLASGTQPSNDALVDVDAQDYFIPALTLAVHGKPIPALDLMASFRWSDKFDGTGKVTFETNTYHQVDTSGPIPTRNEAFKLSDVQVGFPWTLTVGARYAGLLGDDGEGAKGGSKSNGLHDPMDRELWDVEVDSTYSFNKLAGTSRARAGEGVTLITRSTMSAGNGSTSVNVKDLADETIERHLRDSIVVRAGGSYSVVPRRFAIDAGAFFETRGVDPAYANIDTFAFQRFGLGLGGMIRVGDFDLLAGYGHIFQETLQVAPPPHQPVEKNTPGDPTTGFDMQVGGTFASATTPRSGGKVLSDPAAPSPSSADAVARLQQAGGVPSKTQPNRVVNAGEYTASFNVVSVGFVYHF